MCIKCYGDKGIDILWKEVNNWVEDPKKFFRNLFSRLFSNDYGGK